MNIDLRKNERIIREGGANIQRGAEAVGGRLYLTNQRLFFDSHSFNVQTGAAEIPISEVKETEFCWTKFLGVFPLFPNTLAVRSVSGKEYRFVLYGRKEWAAAIDAQQQCAGA